MILIAKSAYAKFPKRLEYYEKCRPKRKKYIKEKQQFSCEILIMQDFVAIALQTIQNIKELMHDFI